MTAGRRRAVAQHVGGGSDLVVFKNPETLEQRMVVVDPNGPDRVIMCMLPPGEAGCHQLKVAPAP
jgi:hypothetical protein